jgi:hypothetical protein
MVHGGAQYIGTGRGFSLTTSQFLKIWTNYSRSHIYPGVELLSLAFLMVRGHSLGGMSVNLQHCRPELQSTCEPVMLSSGMSNDFDLTIHTLVC